MSNKSRTKAVPLHLYKKLQTENKRLKEVAKKVVLAFPDRVSEGEEISFNLPAYIIQELDQALKGSK